MNFKKIGMFCLGFFVTGIFIIPGTLLSNIHPGLVLLYVAAEVGLLIWAIRAYRRRLWNEWLAIGVIIAGCTKLSLGLFVLAFMSLCMSMFGASPF